jgi:hypothetical protein
MAMKKGGARVLLYRKIKPVDPWGRQQNLGVKILFFE